MFSISSLVQDVRNCRGIIFALSQYKEMLRDAFAGHSRAMEGKGQRIKR